MNTLLIDIETYSSVDITKCGNYKYTESPDFAILLFAYSVDDAPAVIVDLAKGEQIPDEIRHACYDPKVLKLAHNMVFEITALNKYFGQQLDVTQWQDTMALSAYLGLPLSLAQVGEVLRLTQKKLASGTRLIRTFSCPNSKGLRVMPEDKPEQWEEFKAYCLRDVDTETEVYKKVRNRVVIPEWERRLQIADYNINKRGVRIDIPFAESALAMWSRAEESLSNELKKITKLENPNSVAQMKDWLKRHSIVLPGLDKVSVAEALKNPYINPHARRALELRQQLGKTSVKKYVAMLNCTCADGRAHGITQYYGTTTGRWCLTPDHEVLTSKGWQKISDWRGGEIACCNPTLGSVSFQKATRVCFEYSGEMYHTVSKRIDQICTPDHKMAYRTKNGSWASATIAELSKHRFSIPLSLTRSVASNNDDAPLRVLVMTQADGTYTVDGVRYHFSKPRKIERCKTLLRKAGIPFVENLNGDGTTVFTVPRMVMPVWLKMFSDKTFGEWLFNESAKVFFDELEFWDGHRITNNSIQYSTVNKKNADIIQAFASLSGLSATMLTRLPCTKNSSVSYILNIWLNANQSHDIRIEYTSKEEYSGNVYCASTPTGFFLVRRNGKVWTTGNSGRLIQTQNLPQNHIDDLDYARNLVAHNDYDGMEMSYVSVPDTLSQLIRTALVPSEGNVFHVCDFSAIECRVLAWLAGENWVLDVFRNGGDIYCATASQMFGVPVEKHGPNAELRQKGKVATLACGYGGGVGALKAMGGDRMGLSEDTMKDIVRKWRKANPNIVKLWENIEKAAISTIITGQPNTVNGRITFSMHWGFLFATLPSGRSISYPRVKVVEDPSGLGQRIIYERLSQETKKWTETQTFGGKIVENLIQGIARDILAQVILRCEKADLPIVFHVHDEVIIDCPPERTLSEVESIFSQPISWAAGLPLKGAGYSGAYYFKD